MRPFIDYSETRRVDREAMTKILTEGLLREGVTVRRWDDSEVVGKGRIRMTVNLADDLQVTVEFDGDTKGDMRNVHVLPFYMPGRSPRTLNPHAFPFDSVNKHHGQKATMVCRGFHQLYEVLMVKARQAKSGEIFAAPKGII